MVQAIRIGTNPVPWANGHAKDARRGNNQRKSQQNKRIIIHLYNPLQYCNGMITRQKPISKGKVVSDSVSG